MNKYMNKYKVKITTTMYWIESIEAENQEEAIREAKRLYTNEEIDSTVGYAFCPGCAAEVNTTYKIA